MTDEELEVIIDKMEASLGALPNPEQEPRRFAWYVKLFNYMHPPVFASVPELASEYNDKE